MAEKVAVVTNASDRLGLSIVKGLCRKFTGKVYLTAPTDCLCFDAVKKLNENGLEAEYFVVNDSSSFRNFAAFLDAKHGGIDVAVFNNTVVPHTDFPNFKEALKTISSIYTPLLYSEEFIYPLLNTGSRVVNISSCFGHLSNLRNEKWLIKLQDPDLTVVEINDFVDEYLESVKNNTFDPNDFSDGGKNADFKVANIALTALSFVQQKELAGKNISINVINPGSVDPEEAAQGPLYLILDASENLKGTFMWKDKKLIDWYDFEGDYCEKV